MCTVVCRWDPQGEFPVQILALRDELASRDFDDPGEWWPDQPGVIGGRDRAAGGTWCASSVPAGVAAVVLNRPVKRVADPGAPSRGVLPLLGLSHGLEWPSYLDIAGMASFTLVLARPDGTHCWEFDGEVLERTDLSAGTYVFTPVGWSTAASHGRFRNDPAPGRFAINAPTAALWRSWLDVIDATPASEDPLGLIVRLPVEDNSYETVFGQFIAARPGVLRLDYRRNPARDPLGQWTSEQHESAAWTSERED